MNSERSTCFWSRVLSETLEAHGMNMFSVHGNVGLSGIPLPDGRDGRKAQCAMYKIFSRVETAEQRARLPS